MEFRLGAKLSAVVVGVLVRMGWGGCWLRRGAPRLEFRLGAKLSAVVVGLLVRGVGWLLASARSASLGVSPGGETLGCGRGLCWFGWGGVVVGFGAERLAWSFAWGRNSWLWSWALLVRMGWGGCWLRRGAPRLEFRLGAKLLAVVVGVLVRVGWGGRGGGGFATPVLVAGCAASRNGDSEPIETGYVCRELPRSIAGSSTGRTPDFESGGCRFEPCPANNSFTDAHGPRCAPGKFLRDRSGLALLVPKEWYLPRYAEAGDRFSAPVFVVFGLLRRALAGGPPTCCGPGLLQRWA